MLGRGGEVCQLRELHAVEAVRTTADGKHVVAAHDRVAVCRSVDGGGVGVLVHAVVGIGGVGASHGGLEGQAREVVRGYALLVLEREVGHGILDLGIGLQQQTAGTRVLGAEVGVAVAAGHGPVDVVEEALEARQDLLVGKAIQKRVEHAVELAHIHWASGDGRHVLVEDLQVHEQVIQVVGGVQTQEVAALPGKALHVAADVARTVGGVAFVHVADGVALKEPVELRRGGDGMLAVLGRLSQMDELLAVGEIACRNDVHELAHVRLRMLVLAVVLMIAPAGCPMCT